MIDVKQAVLIAKRSATEMLQQPTSSLEEIERDSYKNREVWSITLGLPRDPDRLSAIAKGSSLAAAFLSDSPLNYKRFLIDAETGEFVAMKLREVA